MQNTGSRLNLLDSRPRKKAIRLLKWRLEMKCQRCLRDGAQAGYRVFTEMIDIKVCVACADEARKLGINVEPLDSDEGIRFQSSGFSQSEASETLKPDTRPTSLDARHSID